MGFSDKFQSFGGLRLQNILLPMHPLTLQHLKPKLPVDPLNKLQSSKAPLHKQTIKHFILATIIETYWTTRLNNSPTS